MSPASKSLRFACFTGVLALGATLGACGDDDITGQGGGGSGTSSDAATGSTGASGTPASSSSSGSSTTSTSSDAGSGGEGGEGGAGGGGEGGDDASGGGTGSGGEGGGGPLCPDQPAPFELGDEPEDACGVLLADPDVPLFHVEFINEPKEVFDYDGTIAVDFANQYVLLFPIEDIEQYVLTESRCQLLAGEDVPFCSESPIDISGVTDSCSVRYGGRFGLDPENVNPGINEFEFTLTLHKGCALVQNTFTFVVDYEPADG